MGLILAVLVHFFGRAAERFLNGASASRNMRAIRFARTLIYGKFFERPTNTLDYLARGLSCPHVVQYGRTPEAAGRRLKYNIEKAMGTKALEMKSHRKMATSCMLTFRSGAPRFIECNPVRQMATNFGLPAEFLLPGDKMTAFE